MTAPAVPSPASSFGIDHARTPTSWHARMHPGSWMTDGDGGVVVGSVGVLLDIGVSMPGYLASAGEGLVPVTTSIAVEIVPGFDWSAGAFEVSAELVHRDERRALSRGEVRAPDGRVGAIVMLSGRYLESPPGIGIRYSTAHAGVVGGARTLAEILGRPAATPDGAELAFRPGPWTSNPMGVMHGGVILALADHVSVSALPGGASAWRLKGLRISYHRPVPTDGEVHATAKRVHVGRDVCSTLFAIESADPSPAVLADLTHVRLSGPATGQVPER